MSSDQINQLLKRIDHVKALIASHRPLSPAILKRLREQWVLEWTYNSNAIEGNTLTLRETKMVLEDGLTIGGKSLVEHLETINHKEAIEFVEELVNVKTLITERELKDIHALILRKIDNDYAGRYRDMQVRITGSKHTPPAPLQVPQAMHEFATKYLVHPQGHPVEQAALAHFHLVAIHPFVDGNGRTARLLMNLILMQHGYPPAVILKNDRKKYYDTLEKSHARQNKAAPLNDFIFFVGRALERTLGLYVSAIPKLNSATLTMAQAEKFSPYSKEYLGLMARRGVLPAFKLKRDWVVLQHDLEDYVKKQS